VIGNFGKSIHISQHEEDVMKRLSVLSTVMFVLALLMMSCGGGGGGGGVVGDGGGTVITGITYSGVTTQAPLTAANANKIFSLVWSGGPSSGSISTSSPKVAKVVAYDAYKGGGIVPLNKSMVKKILANAAVFSGSSKNVSLIVPVNETRPGMVSGTLTIIGNVDDTTGTGSITEKFTNFNDGDGFTYDGTVLVQINGFDMMYGIITDATMSFTLWTHKSTNSNISITGSMRMQESLQNNSDIMTINLDGRDNISKETFRYKNFVETVVYDNLLFPTSATGTFSGQVYFEKFGYVLVSTVSPCIYSDPKNNPSSGGPIILDGAGNSKASVTPLSTIYVKIEVDENGDAIFESKKAYPWDNLGGASVVVPPVANAGLDQTVETGATVTLDASGSADILGDPLTYMWTMTVKPAGSKAVLSNPTSRVTSFFVDLPGTYTASLTVTNGTMSSGSDEIIITASGPVNSGLFKPYVTYPTGSWPESVAIGDVNGDGRNDVVLTTSFYNDPANDYKMFVLLQNASGGFNQAVKYTAGNGESVAIGDVNNDGRADVIVSASNCIGVFYQNSSGGLNTMVTYASNHQSFSNTYKVKTGDFNHDGRMDVVSIDWGTQSQDVDVFYQNAGGTFNTPITYTVSHGGYEDLEVGDVNNDGFTDIIVMSGQSFIPNLGVLTQKTDGTFNTAVYYSVGANQLSSGVGIGDVNGDSLQDIVVTYGGNAGNIGVFLQNNSGTLNTSTSYSSYDSPSPIEIADVNNDGRKDIILAHAGWLKLGVYLQGTGEAILPEELYPIPYSTYNPHGLAIGDINGDGLNDVVIADNGNGLVVLYHK
jgi:hypothetical protein